MTSNISPQNTGSGACGASGDRKKHGSKTSDARSASESDDDYQKLTAKAGEGDISAGHQTSGGSLQMERTREVTAHSNPSGERTSVANTEMISPRGETTPNQELTELKVSVPKTVVHSNLSGDAKPSNTTYGIEETSKYCRYIEEKDIEVSEECLGKVSTENQLAAAYELSQDQMWLITFAESEDLVSYMHCRVCQHFTCHCKVTLRLGIFMRMVVNVAHFNK